MLSLVNWSSWYQEQLDRRSELEYLVSMQRDVTEDTRELREAIDGNSSLLEGLNETLGLLSQPQDDVAWRRNLYLHGLKYSYWFVVMEFSQLTMAQLQYSGDMRLITDVEVREAMVAYEQGLETARQQSRDVMTYFHELEESHKQLFNLTLSKSALEFIELDYLNMLQPLEVFEPLVPEGEFPVCSHRGRVRNLSPFGDADPKRTSFGFGSIGETIARTW